jgi:hypothetical protein
MRIDYFESVAIKVMLGMASERGAVTQLPRLIRGKTSYPVQRMPGSEALVGATTPMEFAAYVGAKCIGPASVGRVMKYLPDVWTEAHVPM